MIGQRQRGFEDNATYRLIGNIVADQTANAAVTQRSLNFSNEVAQQRYEFEAFAERDRQRRRRIDLQAMDDFDTVNRQSRPFRERIFTQEEAQLGALEVNSLSRNPTFVKAVGAIQVVGGALIATGSTLLGFTATTGSGGWLGAAGGALGFAGTAFGADQIVAIPYIPDRRVSAKWL